jgi:hypothetical protein
VLFEKDSIDIIAQNLTELLQGYLFEFLVEGNAVTKAKANQAIPCPLPTCFFAETKP